MNQNNNDDFFYECMPALEAEMLADLPDEQSLHHPFSKKFQKKMNALIRQQKYTPAVKTLHQICRGAAAVLVVVLLLNVLLIIGVEAYRNKVFSFLTESWEKLTSFVVQSDTITGSDIIIPMEPAFLPEGYEEIERYTTDYEHTVIWVNPQGQEIVFSQILLSQSESIFDTEDANIKELDVSGNHVYILSKHNACQVHWLSGDCEFLLIGILSEDEIIEIIESISSASTD